MQVQYTLYLSDHQLLLVRSSSNGKTLNFLKSWRQPLPAGCMLAGVLHDAEAMGNAMLELRKQAGNSALKVQLVIDSSQVMAKTLSVPLALNDKETHGVVLKELSELDSTNRDLVYDYTAMRPGEQQDLLCFCAERSMLEQLTQLAQQANIKLTGITTALSGCVRMVQFLPQLAQLSFILCVLDGSSVTTYLFGNGRYLMNTRSHLITPRGTPAVVGELLGYISSMIQFSQSNKAAEPARTVYFCGLQPAEEPGCRVVADTFRITAEPLPDFSQVNYRDNADILLTDAFPLAGCMLKTKAKTTNFLTQLNKKEDSTLEKSTASLPWAIPAGLAVAVGIAWGVIAFGNHQLQSQINQLRQYTQNPENLALMAQAETARTITGYYLSAEAEALRAKNLLLTSPQLTASMLARANNAAGLAATITSYNFVQSARTITYSCSAADYRQIAAVVARFRNLEDYASLIYTGYSQNTQTGTYDFQIVCTLNDVEVS